MALIFRVSLRRLMRALVYQPAGRTVCTVEHTGRARAGAAVRVALEGAAAVYANALDDLLAYLNASEQTLSDFVLAALREYSIHTVLDSRVP